MEYIKNPYLQLTILALIMLSTILFAFVKSKDAERSYSPSAAYNIANRTLNTAYMVSDQRTSIVSYNVLMTNTATLVSGNSGQVLLQTKTGAGAWTTISTGQSTIASGLVYSGSQTQSIFGVVGRGDSVRIVTNNLVGTPTYGAPSGIEILIN